MPQSNFEFCTIRPSVICTYLKQFLGVRENFCLHVPYLLVDVGEICYMSAGNASQHL